MFVLLVDGKSKYSMRCLFSYSLAFYFFAIFLQLRNLISQSTSIFDMGNDFTALLKKCVKITQNIFTNKKLYLPLPRDYT